MSSATFKPDYGIYLHSWGLMEGGSSTMPFLFAHIVSVDGDTFCASASSEQFCVTVDMDLDGVDQLVLACPGELAAVILRGVRECRGSGEIAKFPEPIEVTVIGTLGRLQRTKTEPFRPIVVKQIIGPSGIVPVSAALLLVELAMMLEVLDEGLIDLPLWEATRERIRQLGDHLNNQGGFELMKSVFYGAIRYLAEADIDVGRCIEMMWDGIGEWRG